MKTETTLDYAKPYEIMCGIWTGMANVYGPDGTYWDSAPSRVVMYWKDEKTLSYNQIEEHDEHGFLKGQDAALRKAASDIVRVSFDLAIDGKAAKGCPTSSTSSVRNPCPASTSSSSTPRTAAGPTSTTSTSSTPASATSSARSSDPRAARSRSSPRRSPGCRTTSPSSTVASSR